MGSTVYFANARARTSKQNYIKKIRSLFESAGFGDLITKNNLTAIKVHFGERGSSSFVNPLFIRQVVDLIKEKGGKPFVTDTNTLYSGSRSNAVDHIRTAIEHGFNYAVIGAPIIIADGLKSQNIREVVINLKHFKSIKIAADIADADSMIMINHFKGHELSGFAGAIKNMAMGCTPSVGKKEQHSPGIFVVGEKCVGCGQCIEICPVSAIHLKENKAYINRKICTGCGECMTICPTHAIEFDWNTELVPFVERMVEYAYGIFQNKKGKIGFINVLFTITPDCDCAPWSDASIVPDIGILASIDPVALDKASYDLVNKTTGIMNTFLKSHFKPGKDKFKGVWNKTDGLLQITFGEQMGLGTGSYSLVEI